MFFSMFLDFEQISFSSRKIHNVYFQKPGNVHAENIVQIVYNHP